MHSFGALVSDVWTDIHRIRHNIRRDDHPCQLPIRLLERIVLMSTDPGDVVLDAFLGTGTTAIAAKMLGRHFVGIDIDPEYAKMAKEKIEKVDVTMYKGYYVSRFLGNIQSIRDIDAAINISCSELPRQAICNSVVAAVAGIKVRLVRRLPLSGEFKGIFCNGSMFVRGNDKDPGCTILAADLCFLGCYGLIRGLVKLNAYLIHAGTYLLA